MNMNEKGFFTLIGICFLLIAAILVKGVQESEKNYSYVTRNFQNEVELQNVADSALLEAVEMIKSNEIELVESTIIFSNRRENQHQIINRTVDGVNVQVFYEYGKYSEKDFINGEIVTLEKGNIYFGERRYTSDGKFKDNFLKGADYKDLTKKGVILISVASRDSDNEIMGDKKIYRRTLGYFLTDEDADGKIYYMNNLIND